MLARLLAGVGVGRLRQGPHRVDDRGPALVGDRREQVPPNATTRPPGRTQFTLSAHVEPTESTTTSTPPPDISLTAATQSPPV